VAEIGHLAMLEGCKSPEITSLAKCGNFGQTKGMLAQGETKSLILQSSRFMRGTKIAKY